MELGRGFSNPREAGGVIRKNCGRALLAALGAVVLTGCGDQGDPLAPDLDPGGGGGPDIETLIPLRTFPGDTVVVVGSGFGEEPGTVTFAGPPLRADLAAAVVEWTDTGIRVLVPAGTTDGPVRVHVGEQASAGFPFGVAPEVSYADDMFPLLQTFGCTGCHAFGAASGGFEVYPHDRIVASTAVIPRRSGSSRLRQRLLPSTPVSQRMPQGGPYLSDVQILVIADWIDQGARDN